MKKMQETGKTDQILRAAKKLFWKHGIRRVSVDEICREAGVSRMTFYRLFKNKVELVKVVINRIFDKAEKDYKAIMSRDIPFAEKIKEQVRLKYEGTNELGEEFIADIYSGWNKELQKFFQDVSSRMILMVRADYEKAIEKGWIRKDVNIDFIFYMSQKMTEMTTDPVLMRMYCTPRELIMEFMNMMFYGIIPRENE
jgi:AcrR family transcriptional regulator